MKIQMISQREIMPTLPSAAAAGRDQSAQFKESRFKPCEPLNSNK